MGGDQLDCKQDRLHGRDTSGLGATIRASRGLRVSPTTQDGDRINALERENGELRQANKILRKASAYFAQAKLDSPLQAMIVFVDNYRLTYGVEPICRVLPIGPSTEHAHAALGV